MPLPQAFHYSGTRDKKKVGCLYRRIRDPRVRQKQLALQFKSLLMQRLQPSKHTGVLSLVDQEFVLTGHISRESGRNLHRVFDLRQQSDYRVDPAIDDEAARIAWGQAGEFVDEVAGYLMLQGFVATAAVVGWLVDSRNQ